MSTLAMRSKSAPVNPATETAYLVVDTESIPDGKLINLVKYPDALLSPEQAIEKAQSEAVETSWNKSDFLPVTFQIPISVCVARVGAEYNLLSVKCLDAPQYRTKEIVKLFWKGVRETYPTAKLVTFNGRGFDLPLMELAAFRYGISAPKYYARGRNRFTGDLDLMDWMTNFGAYRFPGGLNLLAKLLGKPGKMDVAGNQVYEMHRAGKFKEINDYCLCDTLDTYFIFLRTRVMTGDLNPEREGELIGRAKDTLAQQVPENPALGQYLAMWRDSPVWP